MTNIDLSQLAAPKVVESLDYETILAEMLSDLRARAPEFNALVESDPAYKILEVCAFRELLIRQRVNDAARSVMLAYAAGTDLDHLAALYGVERLLVDPGDPDAVPPVPATYEADDRLRLRTQMAFDGLSTAGSEDAYRFHAMSASADVLDIDVSSPAACQVLLTVLSAIGDGTPDQTLLDAVAAAVSAKDVRPLTDQVTTQAAGIVAYTVDATLYLNAGPDPEVVRAATEESGLAYVAAQHRLGKEVNQSGLDAALHIAGVRRVELVVSLPLPIVATAQQAPYCTGLNVVIGV